MLLFYILRSQSRLQTQKNGAEKFEIIMERLDSKSVNEE